MDALTTDHPYFRAEFDWPAIDEDGHLALISSGGFGPVAPASVYDAGFLEDVIATILELRSLDSEPQSRIPSLTSEIREVARRGFYVFNWQPRNRCYEQVAAPTSPIQADSLESEALQAIARTVKLPLRFSETLDFGPETRAGR